MTKTFETCLAEIAALVATAKASNQAYVGVPVLELEVVLAEADVTVSEAGAVLGKAKKK